MDRTQVGIVGAGPAGLLLAHLLHLEGVESVVLEDRSPEHVLHRVRAGVLEQGTVELLRDAGLGGRLDQEGLVHHGIELRFGGTGHRIDFQDLTGRAIWIYGQQRVVDDLMTARAAIGAPTHYEVEDVRLLDVDGPRPRISYRHEGRERELACDLVAGCDGFHGPSRGSVPAGLRTELDHEYPFAWLGVLAEVAPSSDELVYAWHERGFALHSLRSPTLSRLYLQVDPDDLIEAWPDERIWEELRLRLARDDDWTLHDGPIVEKGIAKMRSFVSTPMQHGSLFLAGDAAHIVPATGAKGLNLAVSDVRHLARAIGHWSRGGDRSLLDGYTARCLRRVWRAQEFSNSMSLMLHRIPGASGFEAQLQLARLAWVTSSRAAATGLAENYVGMPLDY